MLSRLRGKCEARDHEVEAEAMVEEMFEVGAEEMLEGTADMEGLREVVAVHLEACGQETAVVEELGLVTVLVEREVEDKGYIGVSGGTG